MIKIKVALAACMALWSFIAYAGVECSPTSTPKATSPNCHTPPCYYVETMVSVLVPFSNPSRRQDSFFGPYMGATNGWLTTLEAQQCEFNFLLDAAEQYGKNNTHAIGKIYSSETACILAMKQYWGSNQNIITHPQFVTCVFHGLPL